MPQDLIAGQQTHWRVWDRGAARPALALHCMLAHSGIWTGIAQKLDGITLMAPDGIGHGQSAAWDGVGSYHRQATDVAVELAKRLGAGDPIDLIGHSLGGTVALRLALEYPQLVRSLVLIEPVIFAAGRGTDAFSKIDLLDQEMADHLPDDPMAAAALFQGFWGTGERLSDMPALMRDYIVDRIALIPLTSDVLAEDAAGLLVPERLEGLHCPVLLIEGEASPSIIAVIQSVLAARFPRSRRAVVSGAGHMLPLTHKDDVAAAIQQHLVQS